MRQYPPIYYLLTVLLLFSGFVLTDLLLAQFFPVWSVPKSREMPWVQNQTRSGNYMVDPKVGFRPKFETKQTNGWGTQKNQYKLEKSSDKKRLLFIGDSVTADGFLLAGLRVCAGTEGHEYWNGGVGSFNIKQVVDYYIEYLHKVDPDHIIYTLHLNDWDNTPVVFANKDGSLSAYEPRFGEVKLSGFLYRNSNLYNLFLRYYLGKKEEEEVKEPLVRESLVRLKNATANKKLTVLINPMMQPLAEWNSHHMRLKSKTVEILEMLEIQYFDLSQWLKPAIDSGIPLDGVDIWHPGPKISTFLATKLCESGLFENRL